MSFGPFDGNMPDPEKIGEFLNGVKDAFARAAADTRASAAQPHFAAAQKGLGVITELVEKVVSTGKQPGPMEIISVMGIAQSLEGTFNKISTLAQTDDGVRAVIEDFVTEVKELAADMGLDIPNIPGMPSGPARKTPPAKPKSNDNNNKKPPSKKGGKFKL